MRRLAVIGGTGIDEMDGLVIDSTHRLQTPFGEPSRQIQEGRVGGARVFF